MEEYAKYTKYKFINYLDGIRVVSLPPMRSYQEMPDTFLCRIRKEYVKAFKFDNVMEMRNYTIINLN
jgi:hypothetical protein